MRDIRTGHIYCECEHISHETLPTAPPDLLHHSVEHPYSARVTHVLRGGYGIYQCAACEQAGHSPSTR